eukprot:TRINITY_DN11171_c0_g1_i1.p1 TRINITY_DN11171_c0_g1~~TRINITY_DN11171_c0_g1_i1.p1  ORF type:complete len:888 (-),score=175.77 TRINITY_DN11171_c0_g1_i1:99-2387(-)
MAEKHESWAASLIERCLGELRSALQSGRVTSAQLLLRFFVGLGNVGVLKMGAPGVMGLLNDMVLLSEGLKANKGGDLGIFLTLSAVPFLSSAALQLVTEQVDALLAKVDAYMASRDAKWKQLLRPFGGETAAVDRLESIATAIRQLKADGWMSQVVLHVPGFQPSLEGRSACSEKLEPLGLTAEHIVKSKFKFVVPLVPQRLLASSAAAGASGDGDAPLTNLDHWMLEDLMMLTMELFAEDVDECGKHIMRIPVQHSQFEAILVDTIFSQMLRLPHPTLLPLFYSRLLEVLAEKQPSIKEQIEKGFSLLCERASDIDEESLEVLGEAFGYFLMCNGYEADWSHFTGESVPFQAQRLIRRALERLQRLSFHTNLLHRLPDDVHIYVPPEPLPGTGLPVQEKPEFARMLKVAKIKEADDKKVFQFCLRLMRLEPTKAEGQETSSNEKKDGSAAPVEPGQGGEGEQGADGVEAKQETEGPEPAGKKRRLEDGSAEDHASTAPDSGGQTRKTPEGKVEVKSEPAAEGDGDDPLGEPPAEPWPLKDVAELLTCAVMQNGSKTPTHMNKMLDEYQRVFLNLRPTDEDEAHEYLKGLVRSMFAFWRQSGQRLEITIDNLLHRNVLTLRAVVEAALEDFGETGDAMAVWNILNNCARKSLEKLRAVQGELSIAKRLEKEDVLEKCRKQLDVEMKETSDLFTAIFSGLVRNYQDLEEKDQALRQVTLQRLLAIGRKYNAFIKQLIKAAEARIPGVAHNPEIATVFQQLRSL